MNIQRSRGGQYMETKHPLKTPVRYGLGEIANDQLT